MTLFRPNNDAEGFFDFVVARTKMRCEAKCATTALRMTTDDTHRKPALGLRIAVRSRSAALNGGIG